MTVSLLLGLNVDFGLNFSYRNGFLSFLKCHISRSFLPYSSNFVFNFALFVLLTVTTNVRPLDKREISASERFLLVRLITLLLTNLSSNLSPLMLLYYWYYHYHVLLRYQEYSQHHYHVFLQYQEYSQHH